MEVIYGSEKDIDMWMKLIVDVRRNFPGLETEASLQDHKRTVLRFMDEKQAICIKEENTIIGVMLFSRGHNMICCLAVSPQYRRKGVCPLLQTLLYSSEKRFTTSGIHGYYYG